MGEIKQANFRIDKDDADAFRRFCEESHFSQAQGFAYLMRYADSSSAAEKSSDSEVLHIEKIIDAVKTAVREAAEETDRKEVPSVKMTDSRWQQLHYETAKENASLKKQLGQLKEENERLKKFRNYQEV